MPSVPARKRSRLRQMESSVYALAMVVGSLSMFGQVWNICNTAVRETH